MKGLDIYGQVLSKLFLITMAKHAVKIEPIKYLGKYLAICPIFHMQKNQFICDKICILPKFFSEKIH